MMQVDFTKYQITLPLSLIKPRPILSRHGPTEDNSLIMGAAALPEKTDPTEHRAP
ncbi:hypothetical protein EYZ11_004864 [Aspergillus tanneri]|uniref:Uncharacterized protein n=1 Tax=Aspergillus tanneri TaxID=1220188 RepID=A0A4S3JQ93_9EURO|nr:hypothetical protein EYZ11_004864 [Aspergillus tanneri]